MKPCKAKLSDGKPCPHQVDEGQEYCPHHLANQNTKTKNILSITGTVLGVVVVGVVTAVKLVARFKRL
jgi:hypothetical protein